MLLNEWLDDNVELLEGLLVPESVKIDDVYSMLSMKYGNRVLTDKMESYEPADIIVYINLSFSEKWKEYERTKLSLGATETERISIDENLSGESDSDLSATEFEGAYNESDFIANKKKTHDNKNTRSSDKNIIQETETVTKDEHNRQMGGDYGTIQVIIKDMAGLLGKRIY